MTNNQTGSYCSLVQYNFINSLFNVNLNAKPSCLPDFLLSAFWISAASWLTETRAESRLSWTESRVVSLPCFWPALRSVPPCRQLQLGIRPRWAAVMPSPAPPPHQDSHCLCRNFLSVQSLSCPALANPSAAFLSLRKTRSSCHFFMAAVFYQCFLSIVRLHPLFVSGRVFWALWLLIDRREEKKKEENLSNLCCCFFLSCWSSRLPRWTLEDLVWLLIRWDLIIYL